MKIHEMAREQAIEHMQTPDNLLAAGATPRSHGLTRRLTREENRVANETLAKYF